MRDRDLVLKNARNIDRASKITGRTDLPDHLKTKRYELLKIGHQLRKTKQVQTVVRESKIDVWLMTRKSAQDKWKKYSIE
ncbi:hypothetical protein KP79_PYT24157 [Mizuhopecten yessoensis]|uniref:Uncharacterized protein n=1 Tax=Mizuhopecten yessoensis TaxID=6573 RepID=A0A210Q9X7_MIZYE|nr:hypothetical protein KP79_PYT24157 [Mizuhopecten yessoensis]